MPSFILIRPTVWPQYTNVTDRQDRQRTDSIGLTVLQTVTQKCTELTIELIELCKILLLTADAEKCRTTNNDKF